MAYIRAAARPSFSRRAARRTPVGRQLPPDLQRSSHDHLPHPCENRITRRSSTEPHGSGHGLAGMTPSVETGREGRRIVWKPPVYNTVRALLTNPIHAGAYAFGRTASRGDGRERAQAGGARPPPGARRVGRVDRGSPRGLRLLGGVREAAPDRRQRQLQGPDGARLGPPGRRAARRPASRCGHCGRRLHVSYSGTSGLSRALLVPRRASQPRNADLHRLRRHAGRRGGLGRGPAAPEPARRRGRPRRGGDARRGDRRHAAPGGAGADAGPL